MSYQGGKLTTLARKPYNYINIQVILLSLIFKIKVYFFVSSQNENNEGECAPNNGGVNLRLFEELIQASALKFAVKFCSNMAIPRSSVFEIIEYFRKYMVAAFTQGIKDVIGPLIVEDTDKYQVDAFLQMKALFSMSKLNANWIRR